MKMKAILILLAMLNAAVIATAADGVWQMPSQWNGQRYRTWLTQEMFDKSPAWSPESGQEEPLSISKAVAVSAATLKGVPSASVCAFFLPASVDWSP